MSFHGPLDCKGCHLPYFIIINWNASFFLNFYRMAYFPLCSFFLIGELYSLLLFCRYFQGKPSDAVHYLVLPIQIFTVRTRSATSTESNHLHLPISSVKTIVIPLKHYGTDCCVDASINATIITSLSQGSDVIYSFTLLGVVSTLASVLQTSTRHQRLRQ